MMNTTIFFGQVGAVIILIPLLIIMVVLYCRVQYRIRKIISRPQTLRCISCGSEIINTSENVGFKERMHDVFIDTDVKIIDNIQHSESIFKETRNTSSEESIDNSIAGVNLRSSVHNVTNKSNILLHENMLQLDMSSCTLNNDHLVFLGTGDAAVRNDAGTARAYAHTRASSILISNGRQTEIVQSDESELKTLAPQSPASGTAHEDISLDSSVIAVPLISTVCQRDICQTVHTLETVSYMHNFSPGCTNDELSLNFADGAQLSNLENIISCLIHKEWYRSLDFNTTRHVPIIVYEGLTHELAVMLIRDATGLATNQFEAMHIPDLDSMSTYRDDRVHSDLVSAPLSSYSRESYRTVQSSIPSVYDFREDIVSFPDSEWNLNSNEGVAAIGNTSQPSRDWNRIMHSLISQRYDWMQRLRYHHGVLTVYFDCISEEDANARVREITGMSRESFELRHIREFYASDADSRRFYSNARNWDEIVTDTEYLTNIASLDFVNDRVYVERGPPSRRI